MKSSTLRRSGRSSKTGSAMNSASCSSFQASRSALARISGLRELRSVLRLWLKPVFTTVLNKASSHPSSVRSFLISLITADFTFGGGLNAPSPTVKRYSMSYQACRSTERIPYVLVPGFSAIRSATSFWIMQTT